LFSSEELAQRFQSTGNRNDLLWMKNLRQGWYLQVVHYKFGSTAKGCSRNDALSQSISGKGGVWHK